jgi:hypothetical protein
VQVYLQQPLLTMRTRLESGVYQSRDSNRDRQGCPEYMMRWVSQIGRVHSLEIFDNILLLGPKAAMVKLVVEFKHGFYFLVYRASAWNLAMLSELFPAQHYTLCVRHPQRRRCDVTFINTLLVDIAVFVDISLPTILVHLLQQDLET